jgi:uncharacterized RDD family membrane protein YckC
MTYPGDQNPDPNFPPPNSGGFPPPGGGSSYPPPAGGSYPPPGGGNFPPTPAGGSYPPAGSGYPAPPIGGNYPAPPPMPPGGGYGQMQAYNVPPGMYLHQESGLVLPLGTELASVGRRIGAYFLAIPLSIVTLGIGYLIWGLIVWGRGQTPALQVLGMRVWRPADLKKASWGIMALREIVGRIVDGILSIITYLISFILFVSGKEHKSLHDLVAGTTVLYDPNKVLA